MAIADVTALVVASAPIIAAITGVITVYFGRTIHAAVNGEKDTLKDQLATANERIVTLQAIVSAYQSTDRQPVVKFEVPPPVAPTVVK